MIGTRVLLEVSQACHDEIKRRILAAGADDLVSLNGRELDMFEIVLVVEGQRPADRFPVRRT